MEDEDGQKPIDKDEQKPIEKAGYIGVFAPITEERRLSLLTGRHKGRLKGKNGGMKYRWAELDKPDPEVRNPITLHNLTKRDVNCARVSIASWEKSHKGVEIESRTERVPNTGWSSTTQPELLYNLFIWRSK